MQEASRLPGSPTDFILEEELWLDNCAWRESTRSCGISKKKKIKENSNQINIQKKR